MKSLVAAMLYAGAVYVEPALQETYNNCIKALTPAYGAEKATKACDAIVDAVERIAGDSHGV